MLCNAIVSLCGLGGGILWVFVMNNTDFDDFGADHFTSREAQDVYRHFIDKIIIGEQGLVLFTGEQRCYDAIPEIIAHRQWGAFCERSDHRWAGLVREFSANIINCRGFIVRFRGTDVKFDPPRDQCTI